MFVAPRRRLRLPFFPFFNLRLHIRHCLSRVQNALRRPVGPGAAWLSEIDGLRFVAILPVVLQHLQERFAERTALQLPRPLLDDPLAFFISRGTVGVFLFFAISGFVLALPFAKHHLSGAARPELRAFYLRRLTRIEPPYLIWMTVFALVLLAKGTLPLPQLFNEWLMGMTYSHNVFSGENFSRINPVAWSLEVEIQFYLLAPFLAAAYFGIRNKVVRRALLLLGLVGWLVLQHGMGWWFFPMKTRLPGQFQHFLVGFFVADLYLTDWKNGVARHRIWDALAAAAFVTMCYTWTTEFWKNVAFSAALLTLFVAAFRGVLFRRFLQNPWVAVIGGMCYTIYLTHLPLLELQMTFTKNLIVSRHLLPNLLLQAAIGLPVVLCVAMFFFLLLERPFMARSGERRAAFAGFLRQISAAFFDLLSTRVRPLLVPATVVSKAKKTLAVALLLLAGQAAVSAQAPVPPDSEAFNLPPLDTLIKLAVSRAPALRAQDVQIATRRKELTVQRRSWGDLLTASGTALLGSTSYQDYLLNGLSLENTQLYRQSGAYNAGLTLRFTLGDILNRGQKEQIARLHIEQAQADRRVVEEEIREEVMTRYDRFQMTYRMLAIESENLQAQRLAVDIAEKSFREGALPAAEYATAVSKKAAAEKQYETAKSESRHAYRMLRAIAGI